LTKSASSTPSFWLLVPGVVLALLARRVAGRGARRAAGAVLEAVGELALALHVEVGLDVVDQHLLEIRLERGAALVADERRLGGDVVGVTRLAAAGQEREAGEAGRDRTDVRHAHSPCNLAAR
jgi:hypothetical protein